MPLFIEEKKEQKRKRLLDSAYFCFIKDGFGNTSIATICEKAKIAKGTFYLYFQNKEQLATALNLRLSYGILQESYTYMKAHRKKDFIENTLLMADFIMDYFERDQDMLRLMRRDYTLPVAKEELIASKDPLIMDIRTHIDAYARRTNRSFDQLIMMLFSLTSMVATVSYSTIIDQYPCTLQQIKPTVFSIIRKTLARPHANPSL